MTDSDPISRLLDLSQPLGREERNLAIRGEGNTSVRIPDQTFVVKASEANLATLSASGVAEFHFEKLLPPMSAGEMTDSAIDEALFDARVSVDARKPSVSMSQAT